MNNNGCRCAFLRAVEYLTEPEKRLFKDPYSFYFLPPMFRSIIYLMRAKWFYNWMIQIREKATPGVLGGIYCRTRYFDDTIRNAIADGFKAVVNLGAGNDSRALRIEELNLARVIETDHPDLIAAKKMILNKKPLFVPDHLVLVPIDFEKQDLAEELKKAGYSSELKTLFIFEGVSQYISHEAFFETLRFISSTAKGSCVAFT
ncbi:MAG: class I SAM-dependent methyltransferase [Bacillota bacterium]|nr:class I SAM-dependent methyltransferase [Bacillota bacterium]